MERTSRTPGAKTGSAMKKTHKDAPLLAAATIFLSIALLALSDLDARMASANRSPAEGQPGLNETEVPSPGTQDKVVE